MNKRSPRRPLKTFDHVEDFCENILQIKEPQLTKDIGRIWEQEMLQSSLRYDDGTLLSQNFRAPKYRLDEDRTALHKQISEELMTLERLADERDICLGKGGLRPHSPLKRDKQFFMIIGLPASGKSTVAEKIADASGAILIDADIAKRKLPEYDLTMVGASMVHAESQYLVRPDSGQPFYAHNAMSQCVNANANMVYATIGSKELEVEEMIQAFIKIGYHVNLVLVDLCREKATMRAYKRFKQTKRYISLTKIFDEYADKPKMTFLSLKSRLKKRKLSFCHINSDVVLGCKYQIVDDSIKYINIDNIL